MKIGIAIILSIIAFGIGLTKCQGQVVLDSVVAKNILLDLEKYDNLKIKYQNLENQQVLLQEKITNLSEYNAQIQTDFDKLENVNTKFKAYKKKVGKWVPLSLAGTALLTTLITEYPTEPRQNFGNIILRNTALGYGAGFVIVKFVL